VVAILAQADVTRAVVFDDAAFFVDHAAEPLSTESADSDIDGCGCASGRACEKLENHHTTCDQPGAQPADVVRHAFLPSGPVTLFVLTWTVTALLEGCQWRATNKVRTVSFFATVAVQRDFEVKPAKT
jgi:hypothetical protein